MVGKINSRPHIARLVRLWALALAMLFSAISNVAAQADLSDQIAKADIDYGEYLAGECMTCHGKSGSGIPQINGIEAEIFVTIMKAYRSKEMDNKVMQIMAGRLDDVQIISLAAYFSSLPD